MHIHAEPLRQLVQKVFATAGCRDHEASRIAHYLVEANLVGHDSHGVIRVPSYIDWLRTGKVIANQTPAVVFENDVIAVLDGRAGFGQVMGEEAMKLGIAKAQRQGVAVIALRNSGHLGRIGDWPLLAVRAGLVSMHFVNTTGAGTLVPPHGGIQRRLSANPIAAGVPVPGGSPLLIDISTSAIAEGKVRVALNKGVHVPPGCLIDAAGRPTTDPRVFYSDPPGAILPFGGHKGYALGMLAEMLAGALTGGGCSDPAKRAVINNMLTILMAPKFFEKDEDFAAEVRRYIDFVRSSTPSEPGGEILLPGEPEERTRERRLREGIELDETTWGQVLATCRSLNLPPEAVPAAGDS
jgi:uncharacterized oxidoreductase